MRKFKEKDYAPIVYCSTVKLSEQTYKEIYPRCRIRKDLPKEEGYVYVLIPFERIAADAIIEVWKVDKSKPEKYKSAYIKAVNETLRQPTTGALEKLEKSDAPEEHKESIRKILAIVNAYQAKLKEKSLKPLDFINPGQTPPTKSEPPKKEEAKIPAKPANEAEKVFNELLKNQPPILKNTPTTSVPTPQKEKVSVDKSSANKTVEKTIAKEDVIDVATKGLDSLPDKPLNDVFKTTTTNQHTDEAVEKIIKNEALNEQVIKDDASSPSGIELNNPQTGNPSPIIKEPSYNIDPDDLFGAEAESSFAKEFAYDNTNNSSKENKSLFYTEDEITAMFNDGSSDKDENAFGEIEVVNLDDDIGEVVIPEDKPTKQDTVKEAPKANVGGEDFGVLDFTLGLDIDDIINDKTPKKNPSEKSETPSISVEEDEVFPDDYFDDYLKENNTDKTAEPLVSEQTISLKEETVPSSPVSNAEADATSSDEDDDEDIYAAMFGKSIE